MALLLLTVDTEVKWIKETAETPVEGHFFLFGLVFIPAVVMSFIVQANVPSLDNDLGFTKALYVLLPGWNLVLWLKGIKLYCFFIPAWVLFGVIAIIKAILMYKGINDVL